MSHSAAARNFVSSLLLCLISTMLGSVSIPLREMCGDATVSFSERSSWQRANNSNGCTPAPTDTRINFSLIRQASTLETDKIKRINNDNKVILFSLLKFIYKKKSCSSSHIFEHCFLLFFDFVSLSINMDPSYDDTKKTHRPSKKKLEKHRKIDEKKRLGDQVKAKQRNPKVIIFILLIYFYLMMIIFISHFVWFF